jgi:signal transduction histidine kinase
VEISVEDDGIGIPETDRDTIFGPYGRGSATDQPGKGLGLYIARGIAEAHGGTLAFDSARVAGSRFVLTLPISQNPPASIP